MKFNYSFFSVFTFLMVLAAANLQGQGCVAVRPMAACSGGGSMDNSLALDKNQFQISSNYRFFRSYKHFRGDSEQKERVENGTEVINLSHTLELGAGFGITKRLSVAASLPLIYYDRSSLYEHYGNSTTANPNQLRFHTKAQGIGDLRLAATYWLRDPQSAHKNNLAIGVGLKLPTGNPGVKGKFHKLTAEKKDTLITRPVDQSIQLGDGGVGFSVELQAVQQVFNRGSLYVNGFYLFNPKKQNSIARTGTTTGVDPLIAYFSVADQFAGRLGMNYLFLPALNFAGNLGFRAEGIPAFDALGSSDGYRRPGYVVSVEPGVSMTIGNTSLSVNVPIALYRNRIKSVYDRADPAGKRHGDAAFADWLLSVGAVHRFGGKKHGEMPTVPAFQNVPAKN